MIHKFKDKIVRENITPLLPGDISISEPSPVEGEADEYAFHIFKEVMFQGDCSPTDEELCNFVSVLSKEDVSSFTDEEQSLTFDMAMDALPASLHLSWGEKSLIVHACLPVFVSVAECESWQEIKRNLSLSISEATSNIEYMESRVLDEADCLGWISRYEFEAQKMAEKCIGDYMSGNSLDVNSSVTARESQDAYEVTLDATTVYKTFISIHDDRAQARLERLERDYKNACVSIAEHLLFTLGFEEYSYDTQQAHTIKAERRSGRVQVSESIVLDITKQGVNILLNMRKTLVQYDNEADEVFYTRIEDFCYEVHDRVGSIQSAIESM